ncbi:MAG: biosynthetic-type acetolactate synthase large subunit, partial [Victivallaceae bacterium]|nr:biosynthetic-type acetolactate synthase large subunit [Victivallaceae bacterium]
MAETSKIKARGNEITIRCLERQGVDLIFAYPGGFSLELHQALTKSNIRVILPRHEQGGAFAAGGYARATGRVGVCMATSGPGATNLISGIADAYLDSVPTVFLTGQVPTSQIGKNVFQETDMIGMTRPIVKHSYLVLHAADLPKVIAEAFYVASTGRPGPVVVDIPKNVQQEVALVDYDVDPKPKYYVASPAFDAAGVEKLRTLIAHCHKPCIYAGGGVISANAAEELRKFAEGYNIPVATTLMGIGAFPESHPLSLRWLGMHGTVYGNTAVNECDLLLVFGARFTDRVTGDPKKFAQGAKIVHVDIDDSEINKNKQVDLGIVSDIRAVLAKLNETPVRGDYPEWFAFLDAVRKAHPLSYERREGHLQPQFVMQTLCRLTQGKAIIVPGVGQHQMWAAQYYDYEYPRQLLTSGGLGAMGFGLPAAMGAKAARPDMTVINVDGDGSFQMNIQELGTLKVEKLDVKMVIIDNQHLGMVAQWEDRFYNGCRGNTVLGRCYGSSGKPG